MREGKGIKQNWTETKNFEICICVIAISKVFTCGRETGP